MAGRDCSTEGRYAEYCRCELGCPCASGTASAQGHCTGAVGFRVDKEHYGGVGLDGMKTVAAFSFPSAIGMAESQMRFPLT